MRILFNHCVTMDPFKFRVLYLIWTLHQLSGYLASEVGLPKPQVIQASQHTALVEWPDVGQNGGYYVIEYGQDFDHSKNVRILKKSTNKAIIHGLKAGTLYRVRIKSQNSNPGPSVSFRTKPVTGSFGEPQIAMEPRPHNQLLVTWKLPTGMDPLDVVHFNLVYSPMYSPFFMKTSLVLPGHYRKFELKSLLPDTVYKVKLAAFLKERKGPFSSWVLEKTGSLIKASSPQATPAPNSPGTTNHGDSKSNPLLPSGTLSSQVAHKSSDIPQTTEASYTYAKILTYKLATSKAKRFDDSFVTPKKLLLTSEPGFVTTDQRLGSQDAKKSPTPAKETTRDDEAQSMTDSKCQRIAPESICSDNGYSTTQVSDQHQVIKHTEELWSNMSGICKNNINMKRFLCATKFPYCSVRLGLSILPCKSMCTITRNSCRLDGNYLWPDELDCNNFPVIGERMCFSYGYDLEPQLSTTRSILSRSVTPTDFLTIKTSPNPSSTKSTIEQMSTEAELNTGSEKEITTKDSNVLHGLGSSLVTIPIPSPKTISENVKNEESSTSSHHTSLSMGFSTEPGPTLPKAPSTDPNSSALKTMLPATTSYPAMLPPSGKCEEQKLTMCNDVGYKWVQLPNFFNQTHQYDAARSMYQFWPLVEVKCSNYFAHFICSVFTPICTEILPRSSIKGNILPCRSLCEQVKEQCSSLMLLYNYRWPKSLDCSNFPKDGTETCYYPNSDLVKFAKQTVIPARPTKLASATACEELSKNHVCKSHYQVAALSKMSKSFQSVNAAIRNRISMFKDIASQKCLRNLELFMCSLYAPRCSSDGLLQFEPCRSQCKTTTRRCSSLLEKLAILLPEVKKCKQFPLEKCTANRHRIGRFGGMYKSSVESKKYL